MSESTPRTEVEIVGRISFDPKTGLVTVDIETARDERPFGCLCWSFSAEDEQYEAVMDVLEPPDLG